MTAETASITALLAEVGQGRPRAVDQLLPLVYGELRALANHYLKDERRDHTLQPTALVHEAYLRLVETESRTWESRRHFYRLAGMAMRRILVDHARRHRAAKRDGKRRKLSLEDVAEIGFPAAELDLLALDEALSRLAAADARKAGIVELRFFVGLTQEEIGHALGVTTRTIERDWRLARAWLYRELQGQSAGDAT